MRVITPVIRTLCPPWLSAVLLSSLCCFGADSKIEQPGEPPAGYLFAHMMKQDYGRLYYSISTDGVKWRPLNNGKRVFDDYRGHPDITCGHDGRFYLVGGSRRIALWVSKDLVKWSLFRNLTPDLEKTPGFAPRERVYGAPKIYYDRSTSQYLITWHTSKHRKLKEKPEHYWAGQRTLYITSPDLKTFTTPKRLFQYDMATIDVIVRRSNGRYYTFLKDELYPALDWATGKTIRIASSENINGPWSRPSPKISPNFREAPTLIPRPDGKGWYLYYEQYPGVTYGCSTARQLSGPWYNLYHENYRVTPDARHGCMVPLGKTQYEAVLSAYDPAFKKTKRFPK